MDFGAWLAEKRARARITQRDLANKCAVTAAYIAHLENGTSEPPPLWTCKALAHGLGVSQGEVWEQSFAARLKRWLEWQGYSRISNEALLDLVKKIEEANVKGR